MNQEKTLKRLGALEYAFKVINEINALDIETETVYKDSEQIGAINMKLKVMEVLQRSLHKINGESKCRRHQIIKETT